MGLFNKHSNVTLSGDEQDKLDQIELENAKANARDKEKRLAIEQADAAKQKERADAAEANLKAAEANLKALIAEALQPERERCLKLYDLAYQHNAPLSVLQGAIHNGTSVGDFALQLLQGGDDGTTG